MSTVKEKKSLIEKCHLFASDSNGIRKWRKTEEKSFFSSERSAFCECACVTNRKSPFWLLRCGWIGLTTKREFSSLREKMLSKSLSWFVIVIDKHTALLSMSAANSILFHSPLCHPMRETSWYRIYIVPIHSTLRPHASTLSQQNFASHRSILSLSLSLSSTDIVRIFNFSLHAEKQFVFSWANKSERPSTWWIWAESQLNFNRGKNKLSLFSSLEWDYADFLIQSGEMMTVMMMRGRQGGRVVGKIERKTRTQ